MTNFIRVASDSLAGIPRGTVVRADRFDPAEYERLRAAGAFEDAPDANAEAAAPGQAPETFEQTLRGAQATLPNIPNTDVDPETVRARMGVPPGSGSVVTAQTEAATAAATGPAQSSASPDPNAQPAVPGGAGYPAEQNNARKMPHQN